MKPQSRITKANLVELEAARDSLQGFPKYLPRELLEAQVKQVWADYVAAQVALEEVMTRVKLRMDPAIRSLQDGVPVEDTIYHRPGRVVSFQGFMLGVGSQDRLPYITELYKVELESKTPDGTPHKETLVLPREQLIFRGKLYE